MSEPALPRSRLTLFVRLLALLGAGGGSAGLTLACVLNWPALGQFAATNHMERGLRHQMIAIILGGALLGITIGVGATLRRSVDGAVRRAYDAARRLSPLYWVGCLPLLLHRRVWVNREIDFLLFAATFSLGVWMGVKSAQRCPPLGIERKLASWFGPVGSGLWSALPARVRRHWAITLLVVAIGVVTYAVASLALRTAGDVASDREFLNHLLGGGLPFDFRTPAGQRPTPHASFFGYVFAGAYYLAPDFETPLVLHSLLVVGAALPLFLLAKRRLEPGGALLVAASYLLFPALRGAHQYRPDDLLLGLGFFWLAWDSLVTGRDGRACVATLLAFAVGEQAALWFVVLGIYLVLTGVRPRAGSLVALVGVSYFAWMAGYVLPQYGAQELLRGNNGLVHALGLAVTNPFYSLSTLVEACRLADWLKLLVPLALLPLRSPLSGLLLAPGVLLALSARDACPGAAGQAVGAHWMALLFVAVVLALARLRRNASSDYRPHVAAVVALVCASLVSARQLGGLLGTPAGPSQRGAAGLEVRGPVAATMLAAQDDRVARAAHAEVC